MSTIKNNNGRCLTYPMPRDPDHNSGRSSYTNNGFPHVKLNTRLIESIPGGDIAYMKRLITMGANPNATCCLNHVSACHIAAMHDNDALDLLLRSGADRSRSDKQGRTPLHLAAWSGNVKQIALLLNFPEELRKRVEDYVLIISSTVDEVEKHCVPMNEFINKRCHPSGVLAVADGWRDGVLADHVHRNIMEVFPTTFEQGWTALHAASARAHHHCVQLLLAVGADASAQDLLCRIALDVAGCAHYMGHKTDVNNFMETVDTLLKAGGKFLSHCDGKVDTPLHTAVELESEAAVQQMLRGGASTTVWNSHGLTAMHVAVKKRNKGLLQLLANHKRSNAIQHLASFDEKDWSGSTVLCAAVKSEWIDGVRIALRAGATNIKANEESPINYIATQLSNKEILQEDNPLNNKRTSHNQQYINKLSSGETNVLHLAVKLGSKDIVEYLINYPYKNTNTTKLINTPDYFGPPLYYALVYNRPDCARLLISKGAEVNTLLDCFNINCKNNVITRTSLLHIAAIMNHYEIAEMIIKQDSETVHAIVAGRSPLHEACSRGNKKMIELLLRHGADLSGGENFNESYYFAKQRKFVPIELLMNNVSKPTEFMQEIFDSYITSKGQKSNCEVEVDYKVLFPKLGMKHMAVIKALNNTGNRYKQDRLLLHPLVQSFLYLKWRSLSSFFYGTLALHVWFVLSLNVFALSLFWYKDKEIKTVPRIFRSSVWIYIIYLTTGLLIIQEIIVINMKSKRYLLCVESSVKGFSTILAIILPQLVSWDLKDEPEWVRLIGSATLLLTWVRMMFLLSRFPDYGYYVLMYGKVATKVFKILVSFGFLIFGFSISFMIQFHAKSPFEDPWSSLLTTMVMMTSELGYNEIINKQSVAHEKQSVAHEKQSVAHESATLHLIMIRLIFVSFLVLVSIILMNLLIGVAVNDVNSLEIIGNMNRLEKQVQFITSFEDIGCNNFIKKILPTSLYKRWFGNTRWENRIILRPHEATHSNGYILPAHLKETIFEKAQLQKRRSDEEQSTILYQKKLNEIYEVIVKKDDGEQPKSESSDTLNKLVADINKIRSDIEMIKHFIDTTIHHKQAQDQMVDHSN